MSASGWYVGIDGNAPAEQVSLLDVIMHELSHGLGFSGFNNLSTGAFFQGVPDIYSTYVANNSTGEAWIDMTDAGRQDSAVDDRNLICYGTTVEDEATRAVVAGATDDVAVADGRVCA